MNVRLFNFLQSLGRIKLITTGKKIKMFLLIVMALKCTFCVKRFEPFFLKFYQKNKNLLPNLFFMSNLTFVPKILIYRCFLGLFKPFWHLNPTIGSTKESVKKVLKARREKKCQKWIKQYYLHMNCIMFRLLLCKGICI